MSRCAPILVLSNDDLIGLLRPLQIVAAVEAALCVQDAGDVVAPKRLHVQWDGNTLFTMPVAVQGSLGAKVISVVPGNTARGLPVTNGVMILNDGETGVPFAIMNAAALTAQRTGAVGALGVIYLTPPETLFCRGRRLRHARRLASDLCLCGASHQGSVRFQPFGCRFREIRCNREPPCSWSTYYTLPGRACVT